jgi:hypothetical protein
MNGFRNRIVLIRLSFLFIGPYFFILISVLIIVGTIAGVLNSNVFKGQAGPRKPKVPWSLLILVYLPILNIFEGNTDHIGGPHAAREMLFV